VGERGECDGRVKGERGRTPQKRGIEINCSYDTFNLFVQGREKREGG